MKLQDEASSAVTAVGPHRCLAEVDEIRAKCNRLRERAQGRMKPFPPDSKLGNKDQSQTDNMVISMMSG